MVDNIDDAIRVASGTPTPSLAGAIINALLERDVVHLRAVGAGAINQSVKAVAVADGLVGKQGKVLSMRPRFCNVTMGDGQVLSGILFRVESKQLHGSD